MAEALHSRQAGVSVSLFGTSPSASRSSREEKCVQHILTNKACAEILKYEPRPIFDADLFMICMICAARRGHNDHKNLRLSASEAVPRLFFRQDSPDGGAKHESSRIL